MKGKSNQKELEKSEEVIHVRARRGQLCKHEFMTGFNRMGMTVMQDEIINYVHSLQNQVEAN